MEYLTAAQIIADPEMSSEEKLRKLREIEGQPQAKYLPVSQPAPERVLQTLDRPNSKLSGPGYGVAAPMLSQPVVDAVAGDVGDAGDAVRDLGKAWLEAREAEGFHQGPPGGGVGVGTRMPSGTDLTTDEWESYKRILQKHAEARTIPGYVAGGNKYTEWAKANAEPDVQLPVDLVDGRVGPEKTQEQLRAEYEARKLREVQGGVEKINNDIWVSAYNDILTDPRISLAEKTRILDEHRGKSESDVKLRTLGKPVGNIEAFEGDPLGNPYPGYVETDEGIEQGPRPGTARRFVRLPTPAAKMMPGADPAMVDPAMVDYLGSEFVRYRPNSKLSGPARPLKMRYLATEGPKTTREYLNDVGNFIGDAAATAVAPIGQAVAALSDRDANIEAKRDAAPREAAEKKEEAKKTKREQARDDYEAGNLTDEEYANILDETDPLPPPTAAAPAPRPASARAPLPKKPEEPKPWFTEGNAPDTVFDGTDPLSGLVPAATQIKGNVYPSHLEWEAPVPYTETTPDAKKAADIDAEIAKLQEQIGAEERKAAPARAAEEEKNGAVKSFKVAINVLKANIDKINKDVADGKITQVEGKQRIDDTNLRISNLQNLIKNELDKKVPPSQIVQDLNKKKIALIDQRSKITITGDNVLDFVAGLATQLDIPEAEVRTKLLTKDGIQSKDKDGYVKYNLVQNPETGELELVKSKAKYRTAPQMQRDALDASISAERFKIPFEREANIETQENVQKRQADLEKKIVEIQLAGAKLNKRQVDPQRWMRNASLGNKVGAMLYMTLQGIWGGPEYAKKAADDITDLINQDIELQLKSITKDKEYVDFLKEDIGRIDKMFEGREKQIAAKHIIALEKAIQAAKMMPGADPAMVDYLEAELRTKQANEIKTIDEADKKEAFFGWAAPAAPKYGGGGGGTKNKPEDSYVSFPAFGIKVHAKSLEAAGWQRGYFAGGAKSPEQLKNAANAARTGISQLTALAKSGKSVTNGEMNSVLTQLGEIFQMGMSDSDEKRAKEIAGILKKWTGGLLTNNRNIAELITILTRLANTYDSYVNSWMADKTFGDTIPLNQVEETK